MIRPVVIASLLATSIAVHAGGKPPLTTYVAKSNSSRQCEPQHIPLPVMKRELTANGIRVYAALCANDGRIRPAVCGAGTGQLNAYSIPVAKVDEARALGFQLLSDYPDAVEVPCPGGEPPARAVEIRIHGLGPGVDAVAYDKVRRIVGDAVGRGAVDQFTVLGYGREGGFTACAEAGRGISDKGFGRFIAQLQAVKPDPSTTAYEVEPVQSCASVPVAR